MSLFLLKDDSRLGFNVLLIDVVVDLDPSSLVISNWLRSSLRLTTSVISLALIVF